MASLCFFLLTCLFQPDRPLHYIPDLAGKALIKNLGDKSFKIRDASSGYLRALNYLFDIRTRLKEATGSKDPEVARRAHDVIDSYARVGIGEEEMPPLWYFMDGDPSKNAEVMAMATKHGLLVGDNYWLFSDEAGLNATYEYLYKQLSKPWGRISALKKLKQAAYRKEHGVMNTNQIYMPPGD